MLSFVEYRDLFRLSDSGVIYLTGCAESKYCGFCKELVYSELDIGREGMGALLFYHIRDNTPICETRK